MLLEAWENRGALTVAEDLVLEQGASLADLSLVKAPDDDGDVYGAFTLAMGTDEHYAAPIMKWGVKWASEYFDNGQYYRHSGWRADVQYVLDGLNYPLAVELYGVPSYRHKKTDSVADAVRLAWGVVRMLVDSELAHNYETVGEISRFRLRLRNDLPDAKSVSMQLAMSDQPKPRPKENPTKPIDAVRREFETLLRQQDPQSLTVAQDLVMENGTTLHELSTMIADPQWRQGDMQSLRRHTLPKVVDAGVFVLGGDVDTTRSGWWTNYSRPQERDDQGRGLRTKAMDDPRFVIVEWTVTVRHVDEDLDDDIASSTCINCGRPYGEHSEQTAEDSGELCPDSGDPNQRYENDENDGPAYDVQVAWWWRQRGWGTYSASVDTSSTEAVGLAVWYAWRVVRLITADLYAGSNNLSNRLIHAQLKESGALEDPIPPELVGPAKSTWSVQDLRDNPVGEEWQEYEVMVRDALDDVPQLAPYDPHVVAGMSPEGKEYVASKDADYGASTERIGSGIHGQERMVFIILRKPPSPSRPGECQRVANDIVDVAALLNRKWPMEDAKWKRVPWGWGNIESKEFALELVPAVRQNPAEGDEWGPQGAEAFERQEAVRDAIAEPLAKWQPFAYAAMSPLGVDYLRSVGVVPLPADKRRGVTATFSSLSHDGYFSPNFVLVKLLGDTSTAPPYDALPDVARAFDVAVATLNNDWPLPHATWAWDNWSPRHGWYVVFLREDAIKNPPHQGPREPPITEWSPSNDSVRGYHPRRSWQYKAGYDTAKWNLERLPTITTAQPDDLVAIDALLEGRVKEGLEMVPFATETTDTAFDAFDAALSRALLPGGAIGDPQHLRWKTPGSKEAVASSQRTHDHDIKLWTEGYIQKVLDVLERRNGLRENPGGVGVPSNDRSGVSFDESVRPHIRVLDLDRDDEDHAGEIPLDEHAPVLDAVTHLEAYKARYSHDLHEYSEHDDSRIIYVLVGLTTAELEDVYRFVVLRENPGGSGSPSHHGGGAGAYLVGIPTPHGPRIVAASNGWPDTVEYYYPEGVESPIDWAVAFLWDESAIDLSPGSNGTEQYAFYGTDGSALVTFTLENFNEGQMTMINDRLTAMTVGVNPARKFKSNARPTFNDRELLSLAARNFLATPTERPARARKFRSNPPGWVTQQLASAWTSLEDKVPAKWLPKISKTTAKGKKLVADIKEYGCGVYGCVMPTLDPAVVLKITTDDTEAQFAMELASKMPPNVVTKYELAIELPDDHQGRNVYLLWRESADHVGEINKVLGKQADAAVDNQHGIAQDALREAWDIDKGKGDYQTLVECLASWLAALHVMSVNPQLKELADGMRNAFIDHRVFMGDVHGGNLGLASGKWVITDPGNVVIVDTDTVNDAVAMFSDWRNSKHERSAVKRAWG